MNENHARTLALGGNFVEPALFRAPLAPTSSSGFDHPPTERELFSPVLHLVRYRDGELDRVVDDINRTGYGLSAGVFTSDVEAGRGRHSVAFLLIIFSPLL